MYEGHLPDRRLARRADALQEAMTRRQAVGVAGVSRDWAEQMAFYRLLRNERVREADLIDALGSEAKRSAESLGAGSKHLLLIEDTTQLNFEAHRGRLKATRGLGVIGDRQSTGFFLHPTLVLEAETQHALGFSDVQLWSRAAEAPTKETRDYTQQPLETKESVRWVRSLERSQARLGADVPLTGIADREGDLYPLFARTAGRMELIVRACRNRRIQEEGALLYDYLAAQPCRGETQLQVRTDPRTKRQGRRARLAYRYARVTLPRPRRWTEERAQPVGLWAVEVREQAETVPAGEAPIHWRLLTTHRVETLEAAKQVVAWYRARWHIEQVFRLLKLEGLDVESSALESGAALRRLSVLALQAALDVLRLLRAERQGSEQPLEQVFDAPARACLEAVAAQVNGRTKKQQNPHAPHTLAWAAWILARLGGWNGYRSQRAAGPMTYRRGWTRFTQLCHGFQLASPRSV